MEKLPTLKITWEVEDGYVGTSRPQHTKIDLNDDFDPEDWEEMSLEDKQDYIDEIVYEDFQERIGYYIEDYDLD